MLQVRARRYRGRIGAAALHRGLGVIAALSISGCAHPPPPVAVAPVVHRVRMAVLPTESEHFPRVADEANAALRDVQVAGVDERFVSQVSLEVVQLSIECVDPTPACLTAAGKALAADRLLLAQIAATKKHARSLQVSLVLFDVGAGVPLRTAERVFKNADEATRGMKALAQEVAGPAPSVASGGSGAR